MRKNSYLILFILVFNTQSFAKYKIVTSITPLASISAMLLEEKDVDISSIAASNDCPHHFHANPSHLKVIQAADISIYIHETFDSFASRLILNSTSKIVRLGDINTLNIVKDIKGSNWHIWLDLDNVNIILKYLSEVFISQFPDLKDSIKDNLKRAIFQISSLSKIKEQKLHRNPKVILLSDSLEYFFTSNQVARKFYEPEYKSLKFLNDIDKLLSNHESIKCLIVSKNQDVKLYKKFGIPLIHIESENWTLEGNLRDLFKNKYVQMINDLEKCFSD